MALYAIGDLHLSLGGDKSMEVFGGRWLDYVNKIERGFSMLSEDDVVVLCGDLTWGMSMEDALEDFRFLARLPGKKIILKGNHDYWWSTAGKAYKFFEQNELSGFEIGLTTVMSREFVLREALEPLRERYDHILIDCMPSLGMMNINALTAADKVIIPSQASYLCPPALRAQGRECSFYCADQVRGRKA